MFLLIYNPPTSSPCRSQADALVDIHLLILKRRSCIFEFSQSIIDIILTSTPDLVTICVEDSLYWNHFPVFAWFSLPMLLSNQRSETTSKYSASSFSTHCFNQKLSTGYYDLNFPNSRFLQFSFDDYAAF